MDIPERKNMINHGQYAVWLKYSRQYIKRSVYEHEGKNYIVYGGQLVEVRHGRMEYITVENF